MVFYHFFRKWMDMIWFMFEDAPYHVENNENSAWVTIWTLNASRDFTTVSIWYCQTQRWPDKAPFADVKTLQNSKHVSIFKPKKKIHYKKSFRLKLQSFANDLETTKHKKDNGILVSEIFFSFSTPTIFSMRSPWMCIFRTKCKTHQYLCVTKLFHSESFLFIRNTLPTIVNVGWEKHQTQHNKTKQNSWWSI